MNLRRRLRAPRNCVILACAFSMLTVTSVADVLSNDLLQANQANVRTLLGFLLIALVLILLGSLTLVRFRVKGKNTWEKRADERDFAKLIEESVQAGQSQLEKRPG